ncbi:type I DNA topoisomerase [Breznakiellaceae bacterium SP9]
MAARKVLTEKANEQGEEGASGGDASERTVKRPRTKVKKAEDASGDSIKAAKSQKTLVIVESPAKAKTIEKYLGPAYSVKASMGHLIDLPKSRMAIDIENNFEPEYITVRGRAKLLNELLADAKKASAVLLASDNDREGEAIAWHLRNSIAGKSAQVPIQRITFNEITPQAIKAAVANPAAIDESKVRAQKARRVLDRLVGYNLSPLLWKKVKNGLSAGRVQSVALRLICEREKEVESFVPEEYWTLRVDFKAAHLKGLFPFQLVLWKGQKPVLKSADEVTAIIEALKGVEGTVIEVRELDKTIKPKPPFTTSQLQQAAANRLGFTSSKTMQIAQQLYEGINIGASRVGLISYMRTDSVRIAQTAIDDVRQWLGEHFPQELPEKQIEYTVGKKAQDAHEAIRPTYTKYTPDDDDIKDSLTKDQQRLYAIIWERFVASQMTSAKTRTISTDVRAGEGIFRLAGTKIIEKGFYKVLKLLLSKEEKDSSYAVLKAGDKLTPEKFNSEQHFTLGPARYTDASIVKTLEEKGIGRPSTYAPIIGTLLSRYYVTRSAKQLVPTLLGRMICDMLVEYFSGVVNIDFTASMETKLDEVEENALEWPQMIREFYQPFKVRLDEVGKTLESFKGSLDEVTDMVCEKCGKPMLKRLGRFGYFIACSGFPKCHNTKSIPLAKCPKCTGDIIARKTKKRGKEFYGCTNYPACDFVSHLKPTGELCPQCGQFLVEKGHQKNNGVRICSNPDCKYSTETAESKEAAPETQGEEA